MVGFLTVKYPFQLNELTVQFQSIATYILMQNNHLIESLCILANPNAKSSRRTHRRAAPQEPEG